MKKSVSLALVATCCLLVATTAQTRGRRKAAAAQDAATVTLTNFQFAPATVTVKAGGTVTWTNKEGTHTVSADNGAWESPTLSAGQSFSQKFDKPGTYRYYCSFHGSKGGHDMAGVVRVTR
ncbi:MAG TPA: plastocyanin/azurin family copper-binding protein [Pyrinomonadaceae bacterium]|jgi:plastocyanin